MARWLSQRIARISIIFLMFLCLSKTLRAPGLVPSGKLLLTFMCTRSSPVTHHIPERDGMWGGFNSENRLGFSLKGNHSNVEMLKCSNEWIVWVCLVCVWCAHHLPICSQSNSDVSSCLLILHFFLFLFFLPLVPIHLLLRATDNRYFACTHTLLYLFVFSSQCSPLPTSFPS